MRQPKVWYTSDTHVGHRLVARERGFIDVTTVEEFRGETVYAADPLAHDNFLADVWDNTVHENDTVFLLGDISISGSDYALEWHAKRPGKKILIMGNHDPVWPYHRNAAKAFKKWSGVFDAMFPFYRRKLGGKYLLLSHFSYMGTGAEGHGVEDRYPQFRLPDMGVPLVHGHTHDKNQRAHFSDDGTPQLHVGLDAWDMKFLEQETVQAWLENPESSFFS